MISDKVYELCTSNDSLSTELRKTPDKKPGEVSDALYGSHHLKIVDSNPPSDRSPATPEQLERARQCGSFGTEWPSELFLRAWNDVLTTLEKDPVAGICSPSRLGSTGVVPFTVMGPVLDICQHMSNLIARAQKEVLLATNYWMYSKASRLINVGLIELSKRAGERGQKIPVKIMYDRGNPKQFIKNHQIASEKEMLSDAVKLPPRSELPNLDLTVVNFHRPMLGTFHAKFMVVDRSIALAQSNNIQDNDNMEMMSHLEGPIVDSLWEAFAISWHEAIQPLACVNDEAARNPPPTFQQESFQRLFTQEGLFRVPETQPVDSGLPEHTHEDPHFDVDIAGEVHRLHSTLQPPAGGSIVDSTAHHLNRQKDLDVAPTAPAPATADLNFFPYIALPRHEAFPMALVSRKPFGSPNHTSLHTPQNEAFLSLIRNAQRNVFIQTPDLNASPLETAIPDAVRRGIDVTYYVCLGYNDAGELLPGQNGTNEMFANKLYKELEKNPGPEGAQKAKERLRVHFYVAKDQIRPVHNGFKQRSCHIKLMIVDDQVAIQGSGNQDTQSWWQSQEVNVMLDSALVCKAWREGIERNQNTGAVAPPDASLTTASTSTADDVPLHTPAQADSSGAPPGHAYGRARDDGCWYDADGKLADKSLGTDPGRFAWAKGMVGAYKRARGAGGF